MISDFGENVNVSDAQNDVKFNAPVFIGGTGRSGTSILAGILGTHNSLYFACHENKLISEYNGLRDVADVFSHKSDIIRCYRQFLWPCRIHDPFRVSRCHA